MIYFLIVVTVGGSSSITGPFLASLLLGIGDVAGLVNHFAFLQVPDTRQFTQRLEFHRTQGRAKREEIPPRHPGLYSRSRAEHDLK